MTSEADEFQALIQKYLGDSVVVTKFVVIAEMFDGEDRQLSKMLSPDMTYWDWMGFMRAVDADMVVDWTEVTRE